MTDIQTALFALRDPAYQAFQSKLIPTIDPQTVIGVRMPALRSWPGKSPERRWQGLPPGAAPPLL